MGGGLSRWHQFAASRKATRRKATISRLASLAVDCCLVGTAHGVYLLLSQEPLDSVHELVHGEGLADVVINAEHFGVGLVPRAFVGGDHDHANGNSARATELFEDEEAGALGHH